MKLRKLKWILGALLTLTVAGVVAVYAVLANLDFEELRGLVQAEVKAATGRDLVIAGPIDLQVSLTPAIRLEDVSFANAAWGSRPEMARVDRFELQVALLPLIGGTIEIKRLVLVEPEILLETGPDGRRNWQLAAAPAGAEEADAGGGTPLLPDVRELILRDGKLTYVDGETGKAVTLALSGLAAKAASSSEPLEVSLAGRYNEAPFTLEGRLGSLAQLRQGSYPLSLTAEAGGATLGVEGELAEPLAGFAGTFKVSIEGADLSGLGPLVGAELPLLGPYRLDAEVRPEGDRLELSGLAAKLGGSDLTGNATLLLGGAKPKVTAKLLAGRLDLADVAPPEEGEAGGGGDGQRFVFRDEALPLQGLDAVNAEVKLDAELLQIRPGLALSEVTVKLALTDGRLSVKPLSAGLSGGSLLAELDLDTAAQPPRLTAALQAQRVDYGRLLKDMALNEDIAGLLEADVEISGRGASPRALAASLNGRLEVVSNEGRINGRLLKLTVGGLGRILDPLLGQDGEARLNCFVVRFDARDGLATSRGLLFDTESFTLGGGGTIDLETEALDLKFDSETREISLASLGVPFYVRGTLADPSAVPDPVGAVADPTVIATILTGPIGLIGSLVAKQQLDKASGKNPCVAALDAAAEQAQTSTTDKVKSTLEGAAEGTKNTLEDIGEGISEGLKSLFGD
ncbi:MAG: AsmA family protein [Rhodospirillales bacterium]|nr:AsmA family protein [Rhodospirillales bacterium]